MGSRRPARWLAPVALIGAVIAVVVVAGGGSSGGGRSSSSPAGGATGTSHTTSTAAHTTTHRTKKHTYVVKPGDVLSAISVKTGVPLAQIERLNPNVDAQSLHAGQRLKLQP